MVSFLTDFRCIMGKKFNYYKTKQNYVSQFESYSDITLCVVKKG